MTEPLYPSRKLSWEEVSRRIQNQLESLLGRPLSCRVFLEDLDYWGLANDTVFTQTEVERLLRATGAGRDEWQENLYPDEEESKSLGMGLSRLLLQQALHGNWETEFCTAESLWLLNYHTVGAGQTLALRLPGVEVPLEELRPQEELFHYFEEHGPTQASLMDFCEPYQERYHAELCWPYPISDGCHNGIFLVPVREGILSLPYDCVEREEYEIFLLEDASLCDSQFLKTLWEDWNSYSGELSQALENMAWLVRKLEQQKGGPTNGSTSASHC